MRIIFILLINILLVARAADAQDPVKWTASAVKTGKTTFKVTVSGQIADGWYIYAGKIPRGGPIPVSIHFDADSLFTLEGARQEKGMLQQKFDADANLMVGIYYKEIVFVQTVKVKAKLPYTLSGIIQFMGCNEMMCMPPSEEIFSVVLK